MRRMRICIVENDEFQIVSKCEKDYLDIQKSYRDNVKDLVNDDSDNNCDNIALERKSKRKKSPVSKNGNPVSHFIYV